MAWLHGSAAYSVLIAPMVLFTVAAMIAPAQEPKPDKLWVYIGTYTAGGRNPAASKGIYRFELDLATGQLSGKSLAGETVNPSFLAIHPSQRFLYTVGETGDPRAGTAGVLDAFAI